MTDAGPLPPDRFQELKRGLADRYSIEDEVGVGAMGVVYRAQDIRHERRVALKVLRPEIAATIGTDRFLREIRIEAQLNHPHILPVYDSGEVEGLLFCVMPFVEGESLRDRLDRERQLPCDEALRICREVADALFFAHARDLIHRDVKPANILLESGHAVLADFGLAKALSAAGDQGLTRAGFAVGTPAYASPEQAAGDERIDGRSDLYSLGCVLYEMLAGQPPFVGPTADSVVRQHLTQPPPSVRVMRTSVPEAVEEILTRLLEKSPADRFSSAEELVRALDAAISGEWKRLQRPLGFRLRRNLRVTVPVAALLVVFVVVFPFVFS
ncbi:MAG: serine/threonine-protein kinase, partial [Longimicrobiales bacterium]